MGIGDIVGGLLIYDAIQEWRADRQSDRKLAADMKQAEADYLARRRARPADIRALLLLEFAYRMAIRPVMDDLSNWSPLADSFASIEDIDPELFDSESRLHQYSCRAPLRDHLRAVTVLPGSVERRLDTPYVRTLAASSESAQRIWIQAAANTWLLVRLLDALATRDMSKISPVVAEYDSASPAMGAFWKDLYRTFATVLRWQQHWDEVVPPHWVSPVTPNDSPFNDEEDQLTGWYPSSWGEKDKAIADYEAAADDAEPDEEDAGGVPDQPIAARSIARAESLIDEGNLESALRHADLAVASATAELREALALRVTVRRGLSQWQEALTDVDRLLALHPRSVEELADAVGDRAGILLCVGRFEEGEREANRALGLVGEEWPNRGKALVNRAISLSALNRPEEALADFDQAARLFPESPRVHRLRAGALGRVGRTKEALGELQKAIRLDPAERADARDDPDFANLAADPQLGAAFRDLIG